MKIRIGALEVTLSAALRRVRAGEEAVVLDREQPIARLIAHEGARGLSLRGPVAGAPAPGAVTLRRARTRRRSLMAYLADERQSHR